MMRVGFAIDKSPRLFENPARWRDNLDQLLPKRLEVRKVQAPPGTTLCRIASVYGKAAASTITKSAITSGGSAIFASSSLIIPNGSLPTNVMHSRTRALKRQTDAEADID
jgi:hypothetical protein